MPSSSTMRICAAVNGCSVTSSIMRSPFAARWGALPNGATGYEARRVQYAPEPGPRSRAGAPLATHRGASEAVQRAHGRIWQGAVAPLLPSGAPRLAPRGPYRLARRIEERLSIQTGGHEQAFGFRPDTRPMTGAPILQDSE